MIDVSWVLLDTETTGFTTPIFVVELAAQRMRGWEPDGPSFRRLLNQNEDIPPEASRVHGYTREILERDGEPALEVYRDFAAYVDGLPLVAYNLVYDLDDVLLPEWQRLGIPPIGTAGFCALRLAQRLLDPVPAGNCKLQTLRQYYRLPERGAHTALGDVETVADLMAGVLRPLAEARGLDDWDKLCAFAGGVWFPSRITFGKFKGRDYREAKDDPGLMRWIEWLAESSNERSAAMGRWYLMHLVADEDDLFVDVIAAAPSEAADDAGAPTSGKTVALWTNPELDELRQLVAAAQARLADLESEYTGERHAVDFTQSLLFGLLRRQYQRRDQARLAVDYRRRFLDTLLQEGEEAAEAVETQYREARTQTDRDYEQAAAEMAGCKALSEDEAAELKTLWRKLVRLYHPDRFLHDPAKAEAFAWLTAEINRARDAGDIATLREIAADPHAFMARHHQGWLDFDDTAELHSQRKLFDSLQGRILQTIEALDELRASPAFELHQLVRDHPDHLKGIAEDYGRQIDDEIAGLEAEGERLAGQIAELTGGQAINNENN